MPNTYPNGNPGVYPPDFTTLTGKFRLQYGDTISVPFAPVQAGFQDYTTFSDAEITNFLTPANNSVTRAIGYAYMQAAASASAQSKTVKDYDLQVDLTKRAADFRATAKAFFEMAYTEDQNTGINDYFDIIEPTDPYALNEAESTPFFDWAGYIAAGNWVI